VRPFISYAREDEALARRLHDDIKRYGAEPWLDLRHIIPGQDWRESIRTAIHNSSHFIALISVNSVNKRGFVQKELREALELLSEFPPSATFIIPVRLDQSEPGHAALQRLQWLSLFPSYEDGIPKLLVSLGLEASEAEPVRPMKLRLDEARREAILDALQRANGDRDYAARMLGLSRSHFYELLRDMRL
jgi:DNA-binding NtrC family response regulator